MDPLNSRKILKNVSNPFSTSVGVFSLVDFYSFDLLLVIRTLLARGLFQGWTMDGQCLACFATKNKPLRTFYFIFFIS